MTAPAGEETATGKTLRDLEWERVIDAVRARCSGPLRATLVLAPADDADTARRAMEETAEALALLGDGEPLPVTGIRDVRAGVARTRKGGALDGPTLDAIRDTLSAARRLRLFLARHRARTVRLGEACAIDPTLASLEEEIGASIEPGGTVSDRASPELRRLRGEVSTLRARIVARLEAMLLEHSAVVQDRFLTLREGRYVIPVRTDAHEKIPGIVHATSGSGATVFVEPRALVETQNRLTIAAAEAEAEELRVLADLSELVADRAAELDAALDALDRADLRAASAKLALDLRAVVPELRAEPVIECREARHPLLVLDGVEVVPSDLHARAGHGVVISGPNAGGKTVALKVLGLFALMARSGLPVPASEGAVIGFFEPVLSDVGDEQSLTKNLSTFSAHVRSIVRILSATGESGRALVLLDELATGTDPSEGAALACAITGALVRDGAAVVVTTHYDALKALALTDPRLRNASVGLDVERLLPTFELRWDVPGTSSALDVAERFGLDHAIVAEARAHLPESTRTFESLVRRLDEEANLLRLERSNLEHERHQLAALEEKARTELLKLKSREERRLSDEGQRVLAEIRDARDEVRAARRDLRKPPVDEALVAAARDAVERAASRLGPGTEAGDAARRATPETDGAPIDESKLVVGARVHVPHLKADVDVVERPTGGRVRVASGAVKLWVDVSAVRSPTTATRTRDEERPRRTERERDRGPPEAPRPRVLRTTDNTLDVRGLRVDDAVGMLDAFVDRLFGAGEPVGFVLHGVGTGALRDAVRERLASAKRWVRAYRGGEPDDGGERVTVFELAH